MKLYELKPNQKFKIVGECVAEVYTFIKMDGAYGQLKDSNGELVLCWCGTDVEIIE